MSDKQTWNFVTAVRLKEPEWRPYLNVKICDNATIHFDTAPALDRQTDRQRDRQTELVKISYNIALYRMTSNICIRTMTHLCLPWLLSCICSQILPVIIQKWLY